jgi:mono/diheme cytochrome c family protein
MRRAALALLLALAAAGSAVAEETPELFPPGPHRDETFHLCIACHGAAVVTRQGMDRERWDSTLTWMTEKHGMPALEGEDRRLVLDYLAGAFPARPAAGGWQSPFAPR